VSDKAVVALSGGLDSTAALAIAVRDHGAGNTRTVGIHYGQRHEVEIEAAHSVARYYGIEHKVIQLPADLFKGSGKSSLVDDGVGMPHLTYKEIATEEGVSPTYVPFRNGNILSVITAFALTAFPDDKVYVYAGMHAEDARNYAYPDCAFEFLGAMANAINVGSYYQVRLVVPFQFSTKADIVRVGTRLEAPFELTHTCYEGLRPACGLCPTCVERLGAFRIAGAEDPIEYDSAVDRSSDRYALP
jgi:7-cyano-7-deazaguanine synthase